MSRGKYYVALEVNKTFKSSSIHEQNFHHFLKFKHTRALWWSFMQVLPLKKHSVRLNATVLVDIKETSNGRMKKDSTRNNLQRCEPIYLRAHQKLVNISFK